MATDRQVLRALARHSGWILRSAAVAAALAAGATFVIPPRWEATVVLLPPDRRAADFRYVERGARARGLRGLMRLFTRQDDLHPLDIWEAVLVSSAARMRLVERFDLVKRWDLEDPEEAAELLAERLSFEAVPYRGYEITVATEDPQLSADLANAATEVLDERISELYADDVNTERTFLEEASRDRAEEAREAERNLAESLARAGLADEREQARQSAELVRDLATALARARTDQAVAARDHGRGSPEDRDAARRVAELEHAAASAPITPIAPGITAARTELDRLEENADMLDALWTRTVEHQAAHDVAVHVLDPARPPEKPARGAALPALLAALLVPVLTVGAILARRVHENLAPGRIPGVDRLRAGGEAVVAWARRRVIGSLVLSVAAGAAGLWFAREPLALVGVVGAAFLVVLAADVRAGWLLLVVALPWAWEYVDTKAEFSIQLPTEPGILLLVLAWAYAWALRPRPLRPDRLFVGPLLILAWMAVCSVTSVYLRYSVGQLISVSGFVLAGALFPMLELRRVEDVERVIRVVLLGGGVAAVIGLVQVVTSPLPFSRAAFYIGHGFLKNHGPYTAFLGFAMGPAFVYLLAGKWSFRSVPVLIVAALATVATVISLARAGWLGMAVLLGVLLVARFGSFVKRMAVPLALITAVLVFAFLRSPIAAGMLGDYVEKSSSGDYASNVDRMQRYIAAGRMFLDRPLTGVGPGAYETAYEDYRSFGFLEGRRGAHSEILRAASEQGAPGVVLLVLLVVWFYRAGWRLMRHAADPRVRRLAAAICAGMLTYTVHGQFNEYWRNPKIAVLMWVFVGLLGALDRISRSGMSGPPRAAPAGGP